MRMLLFLILALLAVPAAAEDIQPTVTLELKDVPFRQALETLSKQANTPVVAEANIRATVNLYVSDVPLEQAVSTIARLNGLRWQRVDFAVSQETAVSAEEIAKAIAALEAVPVTGIAIEDSQNKSQTLFGKTLPRSTLPQLPESCRWQAVYLIQKPKETVAKSDEELKEKTVEDTKTRLDALNRERMDLLLSLSSRDREMLVQQEVNELLVWDPGVRHDVMRGWALAMGSLDPQIRRDFFMEMRDVFQEIRPQAPPQ